MQQHRHGPNLLRAALQEGTQGSLWVSMYLCGVKSEEHTRHDQPVEGSNYSLVFGACETASGVLCPVLCSQV